MSTNRARYIRESRTGEEQGEVADRIVRSVWIPTPTPDISMDSAIPTGVPPVALTIHSSDPVRAVTTAWNSFGGDNASPLRPNTTTVAGGSATH